jgi:hypothetical protein
VPTYELLASFLRDLERLSAEERHQFERAIEQFVADLETGRFRKGLRIKGVKGTRGIFELTWADDGRATFQYGPERREGDVHVIWRRIGGHEIFGEP